MPFVFDTFMTKVRNADHGFFSRGFVREKSALKDLIKILEDHAVNQTGHREVDKALKHIPADKKKKYKDALDYLKSNYPNLTPPAVAPGLRDRVFRVFRDLEFLKSPLATSTDCVIFGHAGQVPDDPRFNGTFQIPMGLTLHFYTLHGQSNLSNPVRALQHKPDDNEIVFNYETYQLKELERRQLRKGATAQRTETTTREGEKIRTVTTDSNGTTTVVRGPERVRPQTEVRTAKGTLVRDQFARPKMRQGSEQIQLVDAQLTVANQQHKKVAKLLYDSSGLDRKKFGPTTECYNYVVKNGLGLHWESDRLGSNTPYSATDILAIQDDLKRARDSLSAAELANPVTRAQAWVPHFVYIHNESVVRLSDLILQVHRFVLFENISDLSIEDFYFAGCRGIHPGWRPHTED